MSWLVKFLFHGDIYACPHSECVFRDGPDHYIVQFWSEEWQNRTRNVNGDGGCSDNAACEEIGFVIVGRGYKYGNLHFESDGNKFNRRQDAV